jgi:hypothetical protein
MMDSILDKLKTTVVQSQQLLLILFILLYSYTSSLLLILFICFEMHTVDQRFFCLRAQAGKY